MAINLTTVAADLKLLTHAELEKLQLSVNGEVAVRIQDERARRRITDAIVEAQGVGYSDDLITEVIADARVAARGRKDPASNVPMPKTPDVMGTPNPGRVPPTVSNNHPTK